MSDHYPFLTLTRRYGSGSGKSSSLPVAENAEPEQTRSLVEYSAPVLHSSSVHDLFEASVTGVQSSFTHLSKMDIAHPPHAWFDAALARQIAIHIVINRFDVPRRRLVEELERSREAVLRAMRTVDERMLNEDFSDSYETMAEIASKTLKDRS